VWAPVIGDRLGEEADADGQLARGELKFVLLGKKLAGSWALVRTRPRQWLLIKHRDQWADTVDPTLSQPRSVVSRRTMAAIARAAGASPRQLSDAMAADVPEPATPAPRRRVRRTGR
jgi:bifunctional non-homologous end joining protein LigD